MAGKNAADPEHQLQETCISELLNLYLIISNSYSEKPDEADYANRVINQTNDVFFIVQTVENLRCRSISCPSRKISQYILGLGVKEKTNSRSFHVFSE